MILGLILGLMCECSQCVCEDLPPPVDTTECASPLEFRDGTLWKPRGDHNPNLVVLLASQHDYENCQVKLKNGGWEDLEYTGRSNPDRQTYRGRSPGGPAYAGKKAGGGVRCFKGNSECFFPIPGAPKNRHE